MGEDAAARTLCFSVWPPSNHLLASRISMTIC